MNKTETNFLGIHVHGSPAFVTAVSVVLSMALLVNVIWIYRDAKRREKSPWMAVLFLAAAGWPISNVWWCWLRPRPLDAR